MCNSERSVRRDPLPEDLLHTWSWSPDNVLLRTRSRTMAKTPQERLGVDMIMVIWKWFIRCRTLFFQKSCDRFLDQAVSMNQWYEDFFTSALLQNPSALTKWRRLAWFRTFGGAGRISFRRRSCGPGMLGKQASSGKDCVKNALHNQHQTIFAKDVGLGVNFLISGYACPTFLLHSHFGWTSVKMRLHTLASSFSIANW